MKLKRKFRWSTKKKERARAWAVLAGFTGAAAARLKSIAKNQDYREVADDIRAEREALARELAAVRAVRRPPAPIPAPIAGMPASSDAGRETKDEARSDKKNGKKKEEKKKKNGKKGRTPLILRMLHTAAKSWSRDHIPRRGAALAYYSMFALGPVLIVAITIAGAAFGDAAARGEIVEQIQGLVGRQGAEIVQTVLANAGQAGSIPLTITGLATLVIAATGAFLELQAALNTIWRVQPKKSSGKPVAVIKAQVFKRLRSLGIVVGLGFLLMVSLVLSAALHALGGYIGGRIAVAPGLLEALSMILTVAMITVLFAMIYRVLPDVDLKWKDVWTGALITAGLFTLGKEGIGLYLGQSSTASTYGAAGSLAVLLLWVYYTAQIVLFGAEFTRVYVLSQRRIPKAEAHAEPATARLSAA